MRTWLHIAGPKLLLNSGRYWTYPGLVLNEPIGALAHLGLGRAYAANGDIARSRAAYQDFFALWKDADPGIPGLVAAKAEYSRLK